MCNLTFRPAWSPGAWEMAESLFLLICEFVWFELPILTASSGYYPVPIRPIFLIRQFVEQILLSRKLFQLLKHLQLLKLLLHFQNGESHFAWCILAFRWLPCGKNALREILPFVRMLTMQTKQALHHHNFLGVTADGRLSQTIQLVGSSY